MKKNLYRIKKLTSEFSIPQGAGYVPFESQVLLQPLPDEAVDNLLSYLNEAAKINDEVQELLVLVNDDGDIVNYNSDMHELLMVFN